MSKHVFSALALAAVLVALLIAPATAQVNESRRSPSSVSEVNPLDLKESPPRNLVSPVSGSLSQMALPYVHTIYLPLVLRPFPGFSDLGQILGSRAVGELSISADGSIYGIADTSSGSHLININPGTTLATDKGTAPGGQNWTSAIAIGPDGKIYGGAGCTTGAFLWSYDPSNGSFTNKGQAVPGIQCFTALALGTNGKIYGGTEDNSGTGAGGYVFEFDPASNTFTKTWSLPSRYGASGMAVGSNNNIYIGTFYNGYPSAGAHLYSLNTVSQTLTDVGVPVAAEDGILSLAIGNNGQVYGGTRSNGNLFAYDPTLAQFSNEGQAVSGQTRIDSLFAFQGSIYGGTGNWSGTAAHVFQYDTSGQSFADLGAPVQGEVTIRALVVTVSGKIFGGTGWHGHLFSTRN